MILIKVIVELTLSDVIRLKQKHTKKAIDKLPIKVLVGKTTWYVSEKSCKMMQSIFNK